jgi:GNAT superfamily N-acetyltransferase
MPKSDVRIRPLQRSDDRSGFRSGNIDLDRYFQRYAGQNQFRHHLGTTYVAVTAERICGFATVNPGELTADSIPKSLRARLPAYPLPILRISRLAVDERDQGKGLGRLLLKAMFGMALDLRDRFGCMGVIVDAKPDAVGFYEGLGFMKLGVTSGDLGDRPEPIPMFLPVQKIAQAAAR